MQIVLGIILLIMLIAVICKTESFNKHNRELVKNNCKTTVNKSETIEDKEIYITSYCLSRKEPNDNSEKISIYNRGDKLRAIGKIDNKWYCIKTLSGKEYIKCKYTIDSDKAFIDAAGIMITPQNIDGVIESESDITDEIVNYAYNYWYLIPENIRNDFKNNGWTIRITNKSISNEIGTDYPVAGVTYTKDKSIVIEGTQSCIRRALVHEIGHYIDYRNNFISESDDFKSRFNSNSKKLLNSSDNYLQAGLDEREYFAELYREAIVGDYKTKFILKDDIDYVLNISYKL